MQKMQSIAMSHLTDFHRGSAPKHPPSNLNMNTDLDKIEGKSGFVTGIKLCCIRLLTQYNSDLGSTSQVEPLAPSSQARYDKKSYWQAARDMQCLECNHNTHVASLYVINP